MKCCENCFLVIEERSTYTQNINIEASLLIIPEYFARLNVLEKDKAKTNPPL
jgi:hypothetical protein